MESSGVLEFARVLAVTVFALLVVVGLVFIGWYVMWRLVAKESFVRELFGLERIDGGGDKHSKKGNSNTKDSKSSSSTTASRKSASSKHL